MKAALRAQIESGVLRPKTQQERARAAYLAICLDMAPALGRTRPEDWRRAISALSEYWKVVQNLYYSPDTAAASGLRAKAAAAGLKKPAKQKRPW